MSLRNIFYENKKYTLMDANHWTNMVTAPNIEIHLNNVESEQITLTTENSYYSFTPAGVHWVNDLAPSGFSYDLHTGVITSNSMNTVRCFFSINVCYTSNDIATNSLIFQLYKNGQALVGHTILTWIDGNTYPQNCCLSGNDDASLGDTYELKVSCSTSSGSTIIPTFLNFSIFSI